MLIFHFFLALRYVAAAASETCAPDFDDSTFLAKAYQPYFNQTGDEPFKAVINYPGGPD